MPDQTEQHVATAVQVRFARPLGSRGMLGSKRFAAKLTP